MWPYLLFWLFLGGIPFIEKIIIEYRYNNNAKWCISEQTMHLRQKLLRTQNNDIHIETEYKLTDKDTLNLDIIIDQFKKSLSADFLSNRLPKYTKNSEVSFLLYLRDFVIKNQDEMKFCNFEMYQLDETTRNSFRKKFFLTDFAITYYKVLFILQTYYVNQKKIKNENDAIIYDIKHIKETIDNKWTY